MSNVAYVAAGRTRRAFRRRAPTSCSPSSRCTGWSRTRRSRRSRACCARVACSPLSTATGRPRSGASEPRGRGTGAAPQPVSVRPSGLVSSRERGGLLGQERAPCPDAGQRAVRRLPRAGLPEYLTEDGDADRFVDLLPARASCRRCADMATTTRAWASTCSAPRCTPRSVSRPARSGSPTGCGWASPLCDLPGPARPRRLPFRRPRRGRSPRRGARRTSRRGRPPRPAKRSRTSAARWDRRGRSP